MYIAFTFTLQSSRVYIDAKFSPLNWSKWRLDTPKDDGCKSFYFSVGPIRFYIDVTKEDPSITCDAP